MQMEQKKKKMISLCRLPVIFLRCKLSRKQCGSKASHFTPETSTLARQLEAAATSCDYVTEQYGHICLGKKYLTEKKK